MALLRPIEQINPFLNDYIRTVLKRLRHHLMAESLLFVLVHGGKLQHLVGKGLHVAFGEN